MLNYQFSFVREMGQLRELAARRGAIDDELLRDRLVDAYVGLQIMALQQHALAGPRAGRRRVRTRGVDRQVLLVAMAPVVHANSRWTCSDLTRSWVPRGATGPDAASEGMRRAFIRARAETIYAGTSEIQKNIISERVLGMPREPKPAT